MIYSAGFESGGETVKGDVVGVCKEEGENFVGVRVKPAFNGGEVGGERAGIGEEAGCVAEIESFRRGQTGLTLEKADPGIKLGGDIYILVIREAGPHKGRVVGADEGYIRVWAVAELGVAVA